MIGKRTLQLASLAASAGLSLSASALVFSPSQAQLFNITDVTADFSGGGSLYTGPGTAYGLDGTDGVIYDMDFAPGTDGFSRVVLQQDSPEVTDLSGFDSFDIGFMPDLIPMSVKTYINTTSGFYESPQITIPTGSDDRISLDLSTIPDPESVLSWGIQMFDPDMGTSFAQTARAFQVGEPPVIVETLLHSFETGFDNWGGAFQPGFTNHSLDSAHATNGSQSLAITRATAAPNEFYWGTEFYLNATDAGAIDAATIVPDPDTGRPAVNATQQEVDDFGAVFNNVDIANTSIAFDVIVDETALDFTNAGADPYTSYIIFFNDGNGGFWAPASSVGVAVPAEGEAPNVQTVSFDLDSLESAGTGLPVGTPFDGFDASTGIIRMGIGLGMNGEGSVFIDNVRLITEVFGGDGIVGDYNGSGQVEQGDLDLVLQNWGLDTDANGIPAGWINDLPLGQIEQTELDGVLSNWGSTTAPDFSGSSVPEPATASLLGLAAVMIARRERR